RSFEASRRCCLPAWRPAPAAAALESPAPHCIGRNSGRCSRAMRRCRSRRLPRHKSNRLPPASWVARSVERGRAQGPAQVGLSQTEDKLEEKSRLLTVARPWRKARRASLSRFGTCAGLVAFGQRFARRRQVKGPRRSLRTSTLRLGARALTRRCRVLGAKRNGPEPLIRKHSRDLPMAITDHAMETWYRRYIA